jgi:hypothetical protein
VRQEKGRTHLVVRTHDRRTTTPHALAESPSVGLANGCRVDNVDDGAVWGTGPFAISVSRSEKLLLSVDAAEAEEGVSNGLVTEREKKVVSERGTHLVAEEVLLAQKECKPKSYTEANKKERTLT